MPPDSADKQRIADDTNPDADGQAMPCYRFSRLAEGGKEVYIEHEGHIYRLRLTKNGKLILNK